MGNVSAILLTIGESTTSKAIAALQQQTFPISEIIIVSNNSPFSLALNYGIEQVKTPYFIQCDADMILDPDCVAVLMNEMKENVGLVHGYLIDPLMGPTSGIKLYNSEACKNIRHNNHFNSEVMYVDELSKQGWDFIDVDPSAETTLGIHGEDISDPAYLFERFRLLGIKIYHRKDWWDLTHRFLMLSLSGKDEAATASDGILCGFFIESDAEDQLTIEKISSYFNLWKIFNHNSAVVKTISLLLRKTLAINPFRAGYLIGLCLGHLRNHHLYKLVPLKCNELKLIANWSFLFGYTAARYRQLNPNTSCITSSHKRLLPFLEYLENKLPYHIQYAKAKHNITLRRLCHMQNNT